MPVMAWLVEFRRRCCAPRRSGVQWYSKEGLVALMMFYIFTWRLGLRQDDVAFFLFFTILCNVTLFRPKYDAGILLRRCSLILGWDKMIWRIYYIMRCDVTRAQVWRGYFVAAVFVHIFNSWMFFLYVLLVVRMWKLVLMIHLFTSRFLGTINLPRLRPPAGKWKKWKGGTAGEEYIFIKYREKKKRS